MFVVVTRLLVRNSDQQPFRWTPARLLLLSFSPSPDAHYDNKSFKKQDDRSNKTYMCVAERWGKNTRTGSTAVAVAVVVVRHLSCSENRRH